jgi:hypothetical protein
MMSLWYQRSSKTVQEGPTQDFWTATTLPVGRRPVKEWRRSHSRRYVFSETSKLLLGRAFASSLSAMASNRPRRSLQQRSYKNMMDSDSEDTDSASSVVDLAEGHHVTAPNQVWSLLTRSNTLLSDLNIGSIPPIQRRSRTTPNRLRHCRNRGPHSYSDGQHSGRRCRIQSYETEARSIRGQT